MISRFFIERPRFAGVIAIIIVLLGIIAYRNLPLEEYPALTPPQIVITATYPGADAETLYKTVIAPLEEEINGAKNMIYMSSTASANGVALISVYFDVGTNPDDAKVEVNNRVQLALSRLPEDVRRQGIQVRERSTDLVKVYTFLSDKRNDVDLSNYLAINVVDELKRVRGVGDVVIFGERKYAVRIWVEPDKLAELGLTPQDVMSAISMQNEEFSGGSLADEPTSKMYLFTYRVKGEGRLPSVEDFGNIIIRTNPDGSSLKLRDVAKVSLDAESYATSSLYSGKGIRGKPSISVGVFLSPGANAIEVGDDADNTLKELSKNFPADIKYFKVYDPTVFIRASINEVLKTLTEAIILVALTMLFFLGHFRATFIPALAIPVSLIGTFVGLYLLGFSVNLLTLFALVLVIGLVVDDAIIVVENVERIMREERLPPKEAAIKSMQQLTPALIAIVIVLGSVFIPSAFTGGFTGRMFQQFAASISIAMFLSGLVALTLTPALSAILFKEKEEEPIFVFKLFDKLVYSLRDLFVKSSSWMIKLWPINFLIFVLLSLLAYYLIKQVPTALVPPEDKGTVMVIGYTPPGSSMKRTEQMVRYMQDVLMSDPRFYDVVSIIGFDFGAFGYRTDATVSWAHLVNWDKREGTENSSMAIAGQLFPKFMAYPDGLLIPLNLPPIMGLSTTGGFEIYIQDRKGGSLYDLQKIVEQIISQANQRPELMNVRTTLQVLTPRYYVEIDRTKAEALGISAEDAYRALQSVWGPNYVNDVTFFGRTYRVYLSGDERYRIEPRDIREIYVRSKDGNLVPLSSLVKYATFQASASVVQRFNMFNAAQISGDPKPGYTSGQALKAIEEVVKSVLPEGYTIAYAGTSYQEKLVQQKGGYVYLFSIIFVFLILVALYESWLLPIAIMLVVPFAVLGAFLFLYFFKLENDVYTQVGVITLIGLSAKNAILLVEFAEQKLKEGSDLLGAILEAVRIRFRPIMMTSFAFIMGSLPLALATGPSAGSRHIIGFTVVGGMLVLTLIGTFFIPVFYYVVKKVQGLRRKEVA